MSEHPKFDELSAYLDGELAAGSTLESHVDSCDACLEQLESMRGVSRKLQDLPMPEIHPAFVQRVLAMISEQDSTRGRVSILRWVYSLAPVAVAAVLIVAVALNYSVEGPATTTNVSDSDATAAMVSILQEDEEALFDQLTLHFARSDAGDSIVSAAYHVSTPEPRVPDTTLLVFALGESNRAHVDQQWPDSKDVRTTISHLNAEESDLFRQMLMVHAQEALLGEASFEG